MSTLDTALAGLRVVDLTMNIAGPLAARLFAELGADVVKVEAPRGDDGRNSTTPFLGREGTYYSVGNRNKRGIVLDLKAEAGRQVFLRLIERCDIFVENMSVGVRARLGIEYETLSALNPRLIQLSISGWGQKGPLAERDGTDVLIQGYTGAIRPNPDGSFSTITALRGDPSAPLIGAFAVMVALRRRDETGKGAHVTTSVLQGTVHMDTAAFVMAEVDPGPQKHVRQSVGGLAPLQSADGHWVYLCAWSDQHFKDLCRVAGFPEVAEDPAYATRLQRSGETGDRLNELFALWVSTKMRDEVIAETWAAGVPAAPMHNGIGELVDEQQVLDNDILTPIDHPTKGRLWQVGAIYEIDGEHPTFRAAPMQGQHTDEVLRDYGYSDDEIRALRAGGAVA